MAKEAIKNATGHTRVVYDGVSKTQGAKTLGTVPDNVIITGAAMIVTEAFTSAGASTVALGNTDTADAYIAATAKTSMDAIGDIVRNAAPLGLRASTANLRNIVATIATADITAGKMEVVIFWYNPIFDVAITAVE